MRVKRRLAIYFGLGLLLLGGRQTVLAQQQPGVFQLNGGAAPPNNGGTPAPTPGFNGPGAAPSSFNGSLAAPEYSSYPSVIPVAPPNLPPEAYGPTVNPWPTVSPFDYSFQSDRNVGGIWEHTERTRGRQWFFNADFLFMSTKPPQGIFGNPNAQTYVRQEAGFLNSLGGSSGSSSGSGSGSSSGSSSTSTSSNDQLLQDEGFITGSGSYFAAQANYYNALDLGALGNLISVGGRFQTGFWNPDNSGFDARFWFGGQASDNFNAADDETQRPKDLVGFEQVIKFLQNNNLINLSGTLDNLEALEPTFNGKKFTPSQLLQLDLQNLRGLPVADNTARGQTIPYDVYFDVKTTSQQIGTNLDYYFTPIFERKWIQVNPSVGVTYMNIKESLSFLGVDSGLLYSSASGSSTGSTSAGGFLRDFKEQSFPNGIDDNSDGIIDNGGGGEPGPSSSSSGSSSSGGSSSSSTGTVIGIDNPSPWALLPATIAISTSSNVVGPTGGLRYLVGGQNFHIIGETKFGVMADFEQISVSGNNIGSTTRVNGNGVIFQDYALNPLHNSEYNQDLIIPTPANPNPNAFSSSQTHAHVSPYFEQSFVAEAPILKYIPYVNKIWPLNQAQFRLGYQFIWIGNVINTNQSIDYEGDPMAGMFPTIQPTHSGWWTQNGSIGASWQW
jgi:hypothetical protein